jgi:hypothetical protein
MSHFGIHSSVQSKYLRSGSIFIIFFLFYNSTFFISSTFHNLVWFFWPPNGDEQDSSDKRIFLGFSFPCLPTLLIGASQKCCHTLLSERTECLQTLSTKLCSWFIRYSMNSSLQRPWICLSGRGNEGELFHQPFVKPVKMLVAPRDLDVIKLKRNGRIFSYIKE